MEKQKSAKPRPSPINRGRGRIGRLLGPRKLLKLGAGDPSIEKKKPAKRMPNPINRGRGRIGRLLGPRNLQKLGVEVAFRETKSVNNNPTKRKRGRPWGSGKLQKLMRAQLEQQFEVTKSARLVQPTAEPHLPAGIWFWNVTSSRVLSDAPLRMCSSAQLVSINSPTESSAVPSTCTEPLSGDNGVIRTHGEKGEKSGASHEHRRINPHPLPGGGQCSNGANYGDITKSCLNYEDMSRAQLPDLEMGTGQLQPNFEIVSGLLAAYSEAKSVNNNPTKRGRGRPRGTGRRHILRAQLEQLSEVRNSAVLVQPTAEPHLLAVTCMANEKEEMIPGGAPLRRCSSAQLNLINSPTKSSAVPSTCTEPLSGDNGVISKHGAKGETPGATQEHSRINPEPLPGGDQCSNEAKKNKEWDTASLMKAIVKKHGDITKSCKFQSQVFKTNCLVGICRIVKMLLETRLADVNSGLLKELYSFIEDAESVNLDVKWLRKHVNEVKEAMSSSANELERLEQAERELRQQNEDRKKAINVKRAEVAKLQSEIEVEEEELALGILSSKDLEAQISCIKSRYNSEVAKLQSEIEVEEEELALGILSSKDLRKA